jgi:hypothetical protein
VYDDFNNARPKAAERSSATLNRQSMLSPGGSGEYYRDATYEREEGGKGTLQQKRHTLIPSGAFGFDARNGDPQYMTSVDQAATSPYNYSSERLKDEERDPKGIELITVPALGAEYTNEEIKAMKKPHKRRNKARSNREKAQKWVKSDNQYFGCLNPRTAVFVLFASLAL